MPALVQTYKCVEPVLAGAFFGVMQTGFTQSTIKNPSPYYFGVGAALTVMSSTLPLDLRAKFAVAAVVGIGASLVNRFEWIHKNKMHLISVATVVSSAFEFSQGQRAYPLAKIGGTLYVQFDTWLELGKRKEKNIAKNVSKIAISTFVLPYLIGCAVQGGIVAYKKFAELNRGPEIIIAVVVGLVFLAAASKARY